VNLSLQACTGLSSCTHI